LKTKVFEFHAEWNLGLGHKGAQKGLGRKKSKERGEAEQTDRDVSNC